MAKTCPSMDPNFRTLSEKQSRARIRKLRSEGWIVKKVRVAGMGTVITKKRAESDAAPLLLALGSIAVLAFVFSKKKDAPTIAGDR